LKSLGESSWQRKKEEVEVEVEEEEENNNNNNGGRGPIGGGNRNGDNSFGFPIVNEDSEPP
jgi:hypothetical protein